MPASLLRTEAEKAAVKPTRKFSMRAFGDAPATRQLIYDNVFDAVSSLPEQKNDRYTLKLKEPAWLDPPTFSRAQHKQAVLTGGTLGRRIRGTWELTDNQTGKVIGRRKQVVARVPYLTDDGVFVHNGNEYGLNHQARLEPGIYTRQKENGEIESHANVKTGTGPSHRYLLDPAKSVFKIQLGQAEMPLMPVLRAMGATDAELREAWSEPDKPESGAQLLAANQPHDNPAGLHKLQGKLLRRDELTGDEASRRQHLVQAFERMELNPEVSKRTLGGTHKNLNKEALLATTKKLLSVSRGQAETDDRDHLAYQRFYGPEDLFAERVQRDHGRHQRQAFWKAANAGSLDKMPSGVLTPQLEQVLLGSGLAQYLEEVNPLEIYDRQSRVTRMGEGGIPSIDSVPQEARNVQPSHLGFIDFTRTPESYRAGVDMNFGRGARKGSDGRIYAQFRDLKTGKLHWKSPHDLVDDTIAFPGSLKLPYARVPVMKAGKLEWVPRNEVHWEVPHFEDNFSPLANLVPAKSAVQEQRVSMASRMLTQALPLVSPEAPLVRGAVPEDPSKSFEEIYGQHLGAIRAPARGHVVQITPDAVIVRYPHGTVTHELDNARPYNRKTLIHQTPVVTLGQTVAPNQLLARSNYTDDQGAMALGLNLRTAFLPWRGLNYEDAVVLSESAAKRFTSSHAYQHELEVTPQHKLGKQHYVSLFPGKFDRATLAKLDDKGVVRPGQEVHFGEPLILAARQKELALNKVHKKGQAGFSDDTVTWEHHDPGIVTDVTWGKAGPSVLVQSQSPSQVGDKFAGRHGNKGVAAAIIPDHQMPHDKDGRPYELLLNPLGIISRRNPAQKSELALGKLAAAQGKPISIPDFKNIDDLSNWANTQLRMQGLNLKEDAYDPATGRKIPNVPAGSMFFMKLHHSAEGKLQARDGGAYSADETPAKGGAQGSKRVAMLDVNALLSHSAIEILRDANLVRGQKNEQLWLQFLSGHTPRDPKPPFVWDKFLNQLRAAGIQTLPEGQKLHIMALTRQDINKLAGDRAVQSGETVRFDKNLEEIPGGLFDKKLTGGHSGKAWSSIPLHEPFPSPVMEEPIRRILGLTQKQYEDTLAGQHTLHGSTGPQAIAQALNEIHLTREIAQARATLQSGTKTARDAAQRKLGYLVTAERLGQHPRDWVWDKAPVLPPVFRPVSLLGATGVPLVSDANFLYKELLEANQNLRDAKDLVGEANSGPERLAVYHALKAVTGLGEPISVKSQEKRVKGILQHIFSSSPKFSTVQRKLLSTTVDNVGRAVIVPNPDLDIDHIGLPEDKAFEVYRKYIVRRLKRRGLPVLQAIQHVQDRTPLAKQALLDEMNERPVYINRAPVLHKYGIMAFRPKLIAGDVVHFSPMIVKGYGADFDGDAVQFHVPATPASVKEAYERMLPSKNLLAAADFKTPMNMPSQEYLGGLFAGTSPQLMSRRPVRHFRSSADARAAFARGELDYNDPIEIVG